MPSLRAPTLGATRRAASVSVRGRPGLFPLRATAIPAWLGLRGWEQGVKRRVVQCIRSCVPSAHSTALPIAWIGTMEWAASSVLRLQVCAFTSPPPVADGTESAMGMSAAQKGSS